MRRSSPAHTQRPPACRSRQAGAEARKPGSVREGCEPHALSSAQHAAASATQTLAQLGAREVAAERALARARHVLQQPVRAEALRDGQRLAVRDRLRQPGARAGPPSARRLLGSCRQRRAGAWTPGMHGAADLAAQSQRSTLIVLTRREEPCRLQHRRL